MERNPNYTVYKNMAGAIRTISKNYFIALKRRMFIKPEQLKDSNGEEDDFEKLIRRVRETYNKLDALEKAFINNDFFYQNYPDWWKDTFSKTTYYRLRRQSMRHFLQVFENEV